VRLVVAGRTPCANDGLVSPAVDEEMNANGHGRKAAADPATIAVEAAMTANVLTLKPDAPLEDAARLMRRERIGAIPIVVGDRLVGILTRSDLLEAFLALAPLAEARDPVSVRGT
jgi:CBS domain-containing protein